jgi:DNA processing protein
MDSSIIQLQKTQFPPALREIPQIPETLFVRGNLPPANAALLTVVGSRNYTNYGKDVISHLFAGLRGYNIAIISGLARGIDSLAHEAALNNGLYTLAVPGSGLQNSVLYPRRNLGLALRILASGGGLMSEYVPDFRATTWSFPQRNRIMVGLSHAVLLIEASEKSGTLITARLSVDYNRELLVVPGDIFRENSHGVHQFLKLGATPITTPQDIIEVLHLTRNENEIVTSISSDAVSPEELLILSLLKEPLDHDTIIRSLDLEQSVILTLLMKMELNGQIREQNGLFYKVLL